MKKMSEITSGEEEWGELLDHGSEEIKPNCSFSLTYKVSRVP